MVTNDYGRILTGEGVTESFEDIIQLRCHFDKLVCVVGKFIKLIRIKNLITFDYNICLHFTTKTKTFKKMTINILQISQIDSWSLKFN